MRLEPLKIEDETSVLARSLSLRSEGTASQEENPHQNPNHAGTLASAFQPLDCEKKNVV